MDKRTLSDMARCNRTAMICHLVEASMITITFIATVCDTKQGFGFGKKAAETVTPKPAENTPLSQQGGCLFESLRIEREMAQQESAANVDDDLGLPSFMRKKN